MSNNPLVILKKVKGITIACITTILTLSILLALYVFEILPLKPNDDMPDIYYMNYDATTLNDSEANKKIKYGYQLFTETPKYIGPDNGNPAMVFQGNRLACKNCHLNAGTKPYSAPLIGVIQRFPQFRGRENQMGTIEDRINGCMERSMNGNIFPSNSKEMHALVKYLEWISRYAPKDGQIEGQGFVKIEIPNRAVNLENGKHVFQENCVVCHTESGKGLMGNNKFTYDYPPLWGDDSYNNGAGMTRVITAAQFIKANMPFGTTYKYPVLTDEEAYDVAGYINQQSRPQKSNPEKDFPDIKKKPVSTPYPPYADSFSVEQHQKGPFQPIMEYYKKTFNISKTK
ncbi:c-type cytochrome [Flavobacteriaceae bacterium XHP0103]|uniref:c-type cytochrome n=1 Tax=Marixanthotalea marina TaxID=2844359 RepID=UPI002989CE77|nr:c-type cytochrome [Marixanthotalea marina]MBU3821538.1 c-type cytochrome [Marixanthotalea marina]